MGSQLKTRSNVRPASVYWLVALLVFLAVSALFGGYGLVADPSGRQLQMSQEWLAATPFRDYLIPGLILFIVLGFITALALLTRPVWGWMRPFESRYHEHWSWLASVASGVALLVWIIVQVVMVGPQSVLQLIYGLLALTIIGVAYLTSVRRYYLLD
jgi:hypothetical protein